MISELLLEKLSKEQIKFNEPMKNHTSFKIGGIADYFITPYDSKEIKYIIKICEKNNIPYYIVGNGSNLLVKDRGFRGAIIQIGKEMSKYNLEENVMTAQAGISLSKLASIALKNNLTGFEFAGGIPGTLGGAVCMNAGAYGGEMKQVLIDAEVIDSEGNFYNLNTEELNLGYRKSIIPDKNLVVTSAKLLLKSGNYDEIKNYMQKLNSQRREKQPLELPSAGSTFKRPEGNFAGKLIMEAGLKGFSVGDAQVSEKHCGFLVNKGNATAEQMLELIEYVQKTVKEKFDVFLEPEIKIIGE